MNSVSFTLNRRSPCKGRCYNFDGGQQIAIWNELYFYSLSILIWNNIGLFARPSPHTIVIIRTVVIHPVKRPGWVGCQAAWDRHERGALLKFVLAMSLYLLLCSAIRWSAQSSSSDDYYVCIFSTFSYYFHPGRWCKNGIIWNSIIITFFWSTIYLI